jgi:DNA-binding transcriptional ArsR family regulator
MTALATPWVATLCGSATRGKALAVLANSDSPMTAYMVAKVGGLSIPKTYEELRKLAEAGVVVASPGAGSRVLYEMVDRDLRSLLQRREPILSWDGWVRQDATRRGSVRVPPTASRVIDLRRFPATPDKVPNLQEFLRAPEKDRDLERAGARRSRISRKLR